MRQALPSFDRAFSTCVEVFHMVTTTLCTTRLSPSTWRSSHPLFGGGPFASIFSIGMEVIRAAWSEKAYHSNHLHRCGGKLPSPYFFHHA